MFINRRTKSYFKLMNPFLSIYIMYRPMMIVANTLHDGKSQSIAFLITLYSIESRENMFIVKFWLVRFIGYRQFAVGHANINCPIRLIMSDGINNQIVQHTLKQYFITAYR